MLKLKLFLLILIAINQNLTAEFLLYKVDTSKIDKIEKLTYDTLTEIEKKELWTLYESTVYRYQWPTVIRFYNPSNFYPKYKFGRLFGELVPPNVKPVIENQFSESEAKEYLQALKNIPYGLFNFIKTKVEEQSNNKYSLTWVPTTIFELFALSTITENEIAQYKQTQFQSANPSIEKTFSLYCKTVDAIIERYTFKNQVVQIHNPMPLDLRDSLIQTLGQKIGQTFTFYGIPAYMSEYDSKMRHIIKKYIDYEESAFINNQFILARGTQGYSSDITQDLQTVDYGLRNFCYGYSLFAGTLFDSGFRFTGAQALQYMLSYKGIGYILLIKIEDFFIEPYTLAYLFALPPSSTLQGLFGLGENFHVRTNNFEEIPASALSQIELQLTQYLSQAKLVKTYIDVTESKMILQSDIDIQKFELINEVLQITNSIKSEEQMEFDQIMQEHNKQRLNAQKKIEMPHKKAKQNFNQKIYRGTKLAKTTGGLHGLNPITTTA